MHIVGQLVLKVQYKGGGSSGTYSPPNTGLSYYAAGIGVSAYGGSNGENGRIVLVY